jgi:drug/metabolite transporter (DMT)-like permease
MCRPVPVVVERSEPLKAAAWMMGAVVSFSLMAVAGREIQTEMNTFELMLYRSAIGFAIVAAAVWLSPAGFAQVRTRHPWLHVRRNLFHYTGQNLWFYAVVVIPLGQLVALEFTNPIWVALLAPLLLHEPLTRTRVLAALLGFAGVLVVAQPGVSPLGPGHAAALLAAVGFAMNTILTKQIMRHDSVLCVIFWMTLSQGAMSLVLSLPGGIPWPSLAMAPWIVIVGITGLSAHYSLTSALGYAPATVVAPMEFVRLPVVAALGMWLYGEPLQAAIFVGAALIIAGNIVNVRDARRQAAA